MTRLDLLKMFVSDPEVQAKYNITKAQVDRLTIVNEQPNDFIATCQQLLIAADNQSLTSAAAASNLNSHLANRLKNKK